MKIHPDDTFEYHLDPEGIEARRTLIYKCGTARHWITFANDYKEVMESDSNDYLAKLLALAERNLVGWKNVGRDFDAKLDDVLTQGQAFQLCRDLPRASAVSEADKKKLQSQ